MLTTTPAALMPAPSTGAARSLDTQQSITSRQVRVLLVAGLVGLFEFFDQFVIAFALTSIITAWSLTYAQAAIILVASGIGSILGSLIWGHVGDRFGRKPAIIATLVTFAACSAGLALTAEGDWVYLALLRIGVGTGAGGYIVNLALVQEFAPARRRGLMSGLLSLCGPLGLFLGATCSAYLTALFGWRFLFVLGALPVLLILPAVLTLRESPRWLAVNGRVEEARRSVAWALGIDPADAEVPPIAETGKTRWLDLFQHKRLCASAMLIGFGTITAFYGIVLWAPTLLMQTQHWSAPAAAKAVMVISLACIGLRIVFSSVSDKIGRRKMGVCYTVVATVLCVLTGVAGQGLLGSELWFLPFMALSMFVIDGGFAVSTVYTAEIWPSKLRASGAGLSYGTGGAGKMVGPLVLALLAGSSDYVHPTARADELVLPFLFFAACMAMATAGFVIGRETREHALR